MLDEALEILTAAWTGEPVYHRGEHYTVDGMRFLPRPVQRPGVPMWVGGYPGKAGPLRRAARYQGFFPVDLEGPDQLAEIVPDLASLRREFGKDLAEPYDVVAALPADISSSTVQLGAPSLRYANLFPLVEHPRSTFRHEPGRHDCLWAQERIL